MAPFNSTSTAASTAPQAAECTDGTAPGLTVLDGSAVRLGYLSGIQAAAVCLVAGYGGMAMLDSGT
jgi:hypothetical protein